MGCPNRLFLHKTNRLISLLDFRQLINWSTGGYRGEGFQFSGTGFRREGEVLEILFCWWHPLVELRTVASFCCRRVARSNLAELQTFPLEKPYGSRCDLRFSLVFWISLYRDCPMVQALHVEYCVHFVLKTNRQTDKAISISDSLCWFVDNLFSSWHNALTIEQL